MRSCLVLTSAALTGFVGCGGPSTPASPNEAQPATTEAQPSPASESPEAPAEPEKKGPSADADVPPWGASRDRIMEAHFKDALLIREAVIAGRPEDAANPATVIANIQHLEELPKGWDRYVEHMRQTASRITNSTSAASAAAAAADLAVSCGLCHQEHGGPQASTEPAPASGTTLGSRMDMHIWAAERLWEGLSVPSGEAWTAGVAALSTEPFPPQVLKDGGVDVRTAASDFSRLVAKAPTKKTIQDKASLYAELLVTCGTCHQAMERKN